MKKLGINHLRVIKNFSKKGKVKISEIEKHLLQYVSTPTARKIIHELHDLSLIKFVKDPTDKLVKLVKFLTSSSDVDKYI